MSEFDEHYLRGLGVWASNNALTTRQLDPGERLILVTDGIINRKVKGGGTFGVDGIKQALDRANNPTVASTAMAIHVRTHVGQWS
jgi:hypothetical protein